MNQEETNPHPEAKIALSSVGDLTELMVKALVDEPDGVEVHEIEGEQSTLIELEVSKEDIGKVIGKRGVTAAALRTILSAAGAKLKKRVILDIID